MYHLIILNAHDGPVLQTLSEVAPEKLQCKLQLDDMYTHRAVGAFTKRYPVNDYVKPT